MRGWGERRGGNYCAQLCNKESEHKDASWEKLARALARMGENQLAERIIEERRIVGGGGGGAMPEWERTNW